MACVRAASTRGGAGDQGKHVIAQGQSERGDRIGGGPPRGEVQAAGKLGVGEKPGLVELGRGQPPFVALRPEAGIDQNRDDRRFIRGEPFLGLDFNRL